MDTDRIFVWFVYVSLAAAIVLMVVTALPGDAPDDGEDAAPDGADGLDEGDAAADGTSGGVDGADDEDDQSTDGSTDGNATDGTADGTVSSDEEDGQTVQDDSDDPVRISGGTNDSATANGTENGSYEPADAAAVESVVIDLINQRREDAYEPTLDAIYLEGLWSIAERHTTDMVERDYFAIENPDGVDTFRRFKDVEPPCQRVDNYNLAFEGIARTRYSPWTNSTWHRTEDEIAASLVANYTDGDELTDDLYADVGVDARFDARFGDDGRGYVVSTVAIC